jgi:hypothetical protein
MTTIPVRELQHGQTIISDGFLPSCAGFVHTVDDVRELRNGCLRVWIDVATVDGWDRCHYDRLFWDAGEGVEIA